MSIDELIAAEATASERNKDAELKPGTRITRGHGRSRTLQMRLNDDEFSALLRVAEERGIPASTLARDLLLDALRCLPAARGPRTPRQHPPPVGTGSAGC